MKRAIMLILLLGLAMSLIAAVPGSDGVTQNVRKLCYKPATGKYVPCPSPSDRHGIYKIKIPGQGEPTMEKVTFFYYLVGTQKLWKMLQHNDFKYVFYGKAGCVGWYWWIGTWKMPVGCSFRYQY